MKEYSPSTQARAANELSTLPKGAVLPRLMTDYGQFREACREIPNWETKVIPERGRDPIEDRLIRSTNP